MRILIALGLFGAGLVAVLVVFVALNRAIVDDDPVDCGTVALPEAAEWAGTPLPDRIVLAGRYAGCSEYDGRSSAELAEAFGPPDAQDATRDGLTVLVYVLDPEDRPGDSDEIRLFLRDDEVVDVDTVLSSGG